MTDGADACIDPSGRLVIMERGASHDPTVTDACVEVNTQVGELWKLEMRAPEVARRALAGQFVMVTVPAGGSEKKTLPRPMALYDWDVDSGNVTIVYRVVGAGTRDLSYARRGDVLAIVGPLGRPFELGRTQGSALLLGRGIGSCSLLSVARAIASGGGDVVALLSGRSPAVITPPEDFARAGAKRVMLAADSDGGSDILVVEARLRELAETDRLSTIYCCGASRFLPLAARLAESTCADIQVSVEAHMACGIGYCHGCAAPLTSYEEAPLVCRDGPCFRWLPSDRTPACVPV